MIILFSIERHTIVVFSGSITSNLSTFALSSTYDMCTGKERSIVHVLSQYLDTFLIILRANENVIDFQTILVEAQHIHNIHVMLEQLKVFSIFVELIRNV